MSETPGRDEGVMCSLDSSNDMEAVATWFNHGFDAAVAQGLADDPTLAEDWLAEHDARVRIAALEHAQMVVVGFEDTMEYVRRTGGGMVSVGYVLELLDELMEEAKEDLE